jgi:serine/threonine protein kinase
MAPEIFKKAGHGKPVDIWAIGVITYVNVNLPGSIQVN